MVAVVFVMILVQLEQENKCRSPYAIDFEKRPTAELSVEDSIFQVEPVAVSFRASSASLTTAKFSVRKGSGMFERIILRTDPRFLISASIMKNET